MKSSVMVRNALGAQLPWEKITLQMDPELMAELRAQNSEGTDPDKLLPDEEGGVAGIRGGYGGFFKAYADAHKKKFGKDFEPWSKWKEDK